MYIYIDVIFVINLIMNCVLLWATARVAGADCRVRRLFLGAVFGAVYIVATIFYPQQGLLQSLFFKALVSVIMVAVAFGPVAWRELGRLLAYFYLIALMTGGTVLGIIYMTGDMLFSLSGVFLSHWWPLLAGITLILLIGKFGWRLIRDKIWEELYYVQLVIHYRNKSLRVRALVDTGNRLRDPLTGMPVVVVEKRALGELFSEGLDCWVERIGTGRVAGRGFDTGTMDGDLSSRIHLIPFSGLESDGALMPGFRPDGIEIIADGNVRIVQKVIIGICEQTLSEGDSFHALLHPKLLERENRSEGGNKQC